MTISNEEAIRILQERVDFWESRYADRVPEYAAALLLAIQALERQTWRSVKDDPPDECIDVLLLFRHNMAVGGWFAADDQRIVWYVNSDDGYYTTTDSVPLYWMYPPDEPEKED